MAGRHRTSKHEWLLDGLAEERANLAERAVALDAREAQLCAREAAQEDRRRKESDILAAAEARDDKADARDAEADMRDREADRRSFLHDEAYGVDYIQARRFAALDRWEARADRKSAAEARSQLTANEARGLLDDRPAE